MALAALLLAANNLVKVFAHRATLPFHKAAVVIVLVARAPSWGRSCSSPSRNGP
ncbi:hypothetical protein ACIBU0_01220 [Streptomyces sp. NPDC049627]|uniref:hypothetical protein n=1 Tax=Streptomyces sp. NPDC049627 TaxID=3365595 RepID=UPI00379A5462